MIKRCFLVLWLLVYCLLFSCTVLAESGDNNKQSITEMDYLEDENGTYDFSTISAPSFSNQFRSYPQDVIALGITKSVYWFRLKLQPETNENQIPRLLQFNNPNIDQLDVYIPVAASATDATVSYLHKSGGVRSSQTAREVWNTSWVFSLPQKTADKAPIYVRLESSSALRLPVMLWQSNDFVEHIFWHNLGFGLFYGILLAMLLFNLFIFFVLWDKTYFYYVLYICSMLFYQFQVHGHLKLWLNLPYPIYNAIFWFFLAIGFIAAIFFTCSFLKLHSEESPWNKLMALMVAVSVLQCLFGIAGYNVEANHLAHLLGLTVPVVIMSLALHRVKQGFAPAKYFLMAWGVLAVGIITWALAAYLPDTYSATSFLLCATASEAILLSFALAARFKALRLKEIFLTKHMEYYRDLSATDELTSLYNRRHLKKTLLKEAKMAQTNGTPLTLLLMDIDHFKQYNDKYGHWEGDQVLIALGKILQDLLETSQSAFRYGGEEFVILLPKVERNSAIQLAENIRQAIQAEIFTLPTGKQTTITVSIGLSEWTSTDTPSQLFQRADQALYKAKANGRNQVVTC